MVTTDSKADVRRKIGDAVIFKYPMVSDTDFVFLRANRRKLSRSLTSEEYTYKQVKLLCEQGAIYITMKSELKCSISDGGGNNLIDDDVMSGNTIV